MAIRQKLGQKILKIKLDTNLNLLCNFVSENFWSPAIFQYIIRITSIELMVVAKKCHYLVIKMKYLQNVVGLQLVKDTHKNQGFLGIFYYLEFGARFFLFREIHW